MWCPGEELARLRRARRDPSCQLERQPRLAETPAPGHQAKASDGEPVGNQPFPRGPRATPRVVVCRGERLACQSGVFKRRGDGGIVGKPLALIGAFHDTPSRGEPARFLVWLRVLLGHVSSSCVRGGTCVSRGLGSVSEITAAATNRARALVPFTGLREALAAPLRARVLRHATGPDDQRREPRAHRRRSRM